MTDLGNTIQVELRTMLELQRTAVARFVDDNDAVAIAQLLSLCGSTIAVLSQQQETINQLRAEVRALTIRIGKDPRP